MCLYLGFLLSPVDVAMSNEIGLKFGHKAANGTNNSINESNMSANSI